jgi:hypothetical protein
MTINSTPVPPTADPTAIQLALNLLTALSDARGTRTRIQQFSDAQDAFVAAKRAHDDAAEQARQAGAALGDLTAREGKLADAQAKHDRNTTALAVASEANAKRGRDLDERARAIDAQASDLQRRTAAFDARVKEFRDQLAS